MWHASRHPVKVDDFLEIVTVGMGTDMIHKASGRHAAEALQSVENESARLESLLSRYIPGSDIARLNRSAGLRLENISPDTMTVLQEATRLSELSNGLFDATIGPLVDLWDYKNAHEPPADEEIRETGAMVDYRDLLVQPDAGTAMLINRRQSVDLGGIGKGYASDRFMKVFKHYCISSAFSNIGGNVSTLGTKPDGSPWRVGIRHPRQGGLIGAVDVIGQAVVTSGDYERFFLDSLGRRHHHILDPRTGYPAASGLISVTVVSDSAMTADALSTAVFVAGLEAGLEMLGRCPPAQAVLIDDKLNVHCTAGLRGCLQTMAGIRRIH